MNTRFLLFGGTAGLVTTLFLAACGDDASNGGETETGNDLALVNDGTLTVCSDVPYVPFEFEDPEAESGYSGFDIDLMQEMANRLDLELSVQVTGFDAIESGTALAADQCDIAASAMTITEDRAQNLGFSDPYIDSQQSLLASTDAGVTTLADLAGGRLGVQGQTTGADYARQNAPEDAEIIEYPTDGELWPALQAGNIDAILQDLPVNYEHAQTEGYEIVEVYETGEQYGFAVKREGKEALLERVNELLAEFRKDSTYQEIYDRYIPAS